MDNLRKHFIFELYKAIKINFRTNKKRSKAIHLQQNGSIYR